MCLDTGIHASMTVPAEAAYYSHLTLKAYKFKIAESLDGQGIPRLQKYTACHSDGSNQEKLYLIPLILTFSLKEKNPPILNLTALP